MILGKRTLLVLGCIQTVLGSIYHFFLPFQFNWGKYVLDESPTINWALYALNNYFCFNLLLVSLFLLYFLIKKKESIQTITALSAIIFLFWVFSFVYQMIEPMPLPANLIWLGILLPGIALLNALLFFLPLFCHVEKLL